MHRILVTLPLLLIASAALAGGYSDLYIIPAAGHTPGAHGTQWRSDVVLHNVQPMPITVEIALIESGRSPSEQTVPVETVHLLPGETRILADVLGTLGRAVTGALVAGADAPFALTSRSYAERMLGQSVPPIAITSSVDASSDDAVLAGLKDDARHRTNLGIFVAASHAPFLAEIELLSETGAPLGSRIIALDEPGFLQSQFSASDVARGAAAAVVRVLEGDGIAVPYASVIDNVTAEAMFVSGQAVTRQSAAARAMLTR